MIEIFEVGERVYSPQTGYAVVVAIDDEWIELVPENKAIPRKRLNRNISTVYKLSSLEPFI